jgi:hypothetical protein
MYEERGDVAAYYQMIEGMRAAEVDVPSNALISGAELCVRQRSPVLVHALLMLEQQNIPSKLWRWRAAKEILTQLASLPEKPKLMSIVSEKIRAYEVSGETPSFVNM